MQTMLKRFLLSLPVLFSLQVSVSQSTEYEFDLIQKDIDLPPEITTSRSVVLLSNSMEGSDWKANAVSIHKQLRRMGIDAVVYVHYQDYQAGPYVRAKFQSHFRTRNIRYAILIGIDSRIVKLAVIPLKSGEPDLDQKSWYSEGTSLNDAILKLAVQLRRMDIPNTNFLISEHPEIIDDIRIFTGTHYPNYPGRVIRSRIAVAQIPPVIREENADEEAVLAVNRKIDRLNDQIKLAFENYPYEFEFVDDQEDELLFNQRYQYVLRFVNTSGRTIKKLLDYKVDDTETDFISIVPLPDGRRTLKTYHVDDPVYKFYIQQTARHDVHVGRYWDADEDIYVALSNFLLHLQDQLK